VLHLVGYDDQTPDALHAMRQKERLYLEQQQLKPRYDLAADSDDDPEVRPAEVCAPNLATDDGPSDKHSGSHLRKHAK